MTSFTPPNNNNDDQPSTSSAIQPVPTPNKKKICEVCGQADRRPTSSFLQNITTCEACKKFLERCQKQNKIKLRCKNGGRRGMTCNLATDRPCAKCRLDKAIQLVTRMKATATGSGGASVGAALSALTQAAAASSLPSSSSNLQQQLPSESPNASRTNSLNVFFQKCTETNTIETVKKLQLKVELLKYLKKSPHIASTTTTDLNNDNNNAPFNALPSTSKNAPAPAGPMPMTVDPAPNSVFSASSSSYQQPSNQSLPRSAPVASSSTGFYGNMIVDGDESASSTTSSLNFAITTGPPPRAPIIDSGISFEFLPQPQPQAAQQSQECWQRQPPQFQPQAQNQPQPAVVQLPMQPTIHDNVTNEIVLRQIMRADQELTAKKYRCDASYLAKKGIPDEETEFWKLVSWCVQDIALANLPFATQLAGSMSGISHIDMCRMVENSYPLMFYAQTGLPNRLDVVTAFSMLFTKMRHAWKEIDVIMNHTRETVTAIREWKPSSTEFAFLLATIFCNSVPKDKIMVPETLTQLERLTDKVMSAARAHMFQMSGENVAHIRYQQLECIIKAFIKLREARRFALKSFYERNPELAKQTVHPVVELVCRQYRDTWRQDYCAVRLPCYPPPINYELRRGVDEFTEVIMNNI